MQKDKNNILYLYKIEEDRYLQITVSPIFTLSGKGSSMRIPTVRNIQFLNDKQVTSKYKKGKLLDLIKKDGHCMTSHVSITQNTVNSPNTYPPCI